MGTGAITQYIDVAQLVLYAFWAFFAGLIYYLLRENHREGYPMDSGRNPPVHIEGWPPVPSPKVFKLANGHEMLSPPPPGPPEFLQAEPSHRLLGAPLEPTGNPLLAGVGPGSWANRADIEFGVAWQDHDPRGLPVLGADDEVAGTVGELWVDRSEMLFRYIEVKLADSGKAVLIPINFARITKDSVKVQAIYADQFADVPGVRTADQITMLEEEKIMAYYGAGTLYADPFRQEPLA